MLLQGVGLSLAKVVGESCLMMSVVLELRPDSLIAPIMVLVSTTVSMLKMLESLVKLLQPHHVSILYGQTVSETFTDDSVVVYSLL